MPYEEKLAQALDIDVDNGEDDDAVPSYANTVPATCAPAEVPVTTTVSAEAQQDFTLVRENLTDIVVQGKTALQDVVNLARGTEHPRAYEVVSQMISSLASANKDLLSVHETKEKLAKTQQKEKAESAPDGQTVNNLFVGSTRELQELLSKRKLKAV